MTFHDPDACSECAAARATFSREMQSDPAGLGPDVVIGLQHVMDVFLEPGPPSEPEPNATSVGLALGAFLDAAAAPTPVEIGYAAIDAVRSAEVDARIAATVDL